MIFSRLIRPMSVAAMAASLMACGSAPDAPAEDGVSTSAAIASCPHNVVRRSSSGWLILNPRVIDIYWGSYWNGEGASLRSDLDSYWSGVANDATFWQRMVEYGIGSYGNYGGSHVIPSPVFDNPRGNLVLSPSDVDHLVRIMAENGQLPRTDANDLFVIYLPKNFSVTVGGAYHGSLFDSHGRPVWYIVQNTRPTWVDSMTDDTSHEIAEAATDPDGHNGYRDNMADDGEIADICHGYDYAYGAHRLDAIWSQYTCQCIGATRPTVVDPCASLPTAQRLCCHKPSLPVCKDPGAASAP